MKERERASGRGKAPLLVPIIATAVILAVGGWLFAVFDRGGQFIVPFFIPALYSVAAFAGLSIGLLAIARFRVLPDPPSYWISAGFFAFAVLAAFVVLTFPGEEIDGRGLIASLPGTAAWVGQIQMTLTGVALVFAAAAPWPARESQNTGLWLGALVGGVLLLTLGVAVMVDQEERLPLLVLEGGVYSTRYIVWVIATLVILAGGALLSTRRYFLTGDNLIGYVAISQVAFTFAILIANDAIRFSSLWYVSRLLGLVGLAATLFGLLFEYVGLYKRERDARGGTLERAQQLMATLESMTDVVFVADSKGRITITNHAARNLLGVGEPEGHELQVIKLSDLLEIRRADGGPMAPADIPFARALAGEITQNEDLIARNTKTGKDILFRTSAAPVVIEGRIMGAVALGKDITEIVDLERMKEDFIRVAAHELKTPVTIMKGYAQALPEALNKRPEQRDRMLAAINHGADRITELVQDLMDISQLQLGDLRLTRERTDLRGVIERVIKKAAPLSPMHDLRLSPGEHVYVYGDGDRLEQVVGHLVENAVKFSPEGGLITITLEQTNDDAVVSVKDRGAGIPVEKQRRIFERFFRAHAGTPLDFGGMGVGLFISKEIVEAHGGRIWFESNEGQGSSFHFSIPMRNDNESK